ncbi:MAG: YIP1 family protein [Acidobacteriota bacterium]
MDPKKLVDFASEILTEYIKVAASTLVHPVSYYQPVIDGNAASSPLIESPGRARPRNAWLHPKLLAFSALSVLLGTWINSLLPGRRESPENLVVVIFVLFYWFFYTSALHLVCRLLKGRGRYIETVAVSIQVLATLYLVTSCLALIGAALPGWEMVRNATLFEGVFGGEIFSDPGSIFFLIHAPLLAVYLSLALKRVHSFGWLRQGAIAIIPFLTVWIPFLLYIRYGLFVTGATI